MTKRVAQIDERAGKLIVSSYSQTTSGLWIMNGWFQVVDADVDDTTLGGVLVEALARSENEIPKPSREELRAGYDKPILRALGLRSTGRYIEGTKRLRCPTTTIAWEST